MTEESTILFKSKPFVLGYCACPCRAYLDSLRTANGGLRRFINGHQSKGRPHVQRREREGYWDVYCPDHPYARKRGFVKEHRLVMEEHLGRYLTKDEVVHHINDNPKDNRIENLQLMTLAEHISYHRMLDKEQRDSRVCYNDPTHKTEWYKKEGCWHWFFLNGDKGKPICKNCYAKEWKKKNRAKYLEKKRRDYQKKKLKEKGLLTVTNLK
jgi:hypothetical protein